MGAGRWQSQCLPTLLCLLRQLKALLMLPQLIAALALLTGGRQRGSQEPSLPNCRVSSPSVFETCTTKTNPREMPHKGTWAHFVNKLERCVAAQTRQELGAANIEHSRLSSDCDALETATTAVVSLIYKLQVRSPELIDEFFSLAEQLVDNTRRFVAADVVLQRVLRSGFTSSDEQRREEIVNAIEAEMENTFFCRKTTNSLMREVGHRGLPPSSEASATTGGASQTADSARHLLPRPPTTPPPGHLLDNSARPARA